MWHNRPRVFISQVRILPWPTNHFLYFPTEFLHTNNISDDYAAASVDQSQWQNKIFHVEAATSLGHCFALCRIANFSGSSYACNMLSYDTAASVCYLGNNDKNTPSHTVPPGQCQVYLDRGMTWPESNYLRRWRYLSLMHPPFIPFQHLLRQK